MSGGSNRRKGAGAGWPVPSLTVSFVKCSAFGNYETQGLCGNQKSQPDLQVSSKCKHTNTRTPRCFTQCKLAAPSVCGSLHVEVSLHAQTLHNRNRAQNVKIYIQTVRAMLLGFCGCAQGGDTQRTETPNHFEMIKHSTQLCVCEGRHSPSRTTDTPSRF